MTVKRKINENILKQKILSLTDLQSPSFVVSKIHEHQKEAIYLQMNEYKRKMEIYEKYNYELKTIMDLYEDFILFMVTNKKSSFSIEKLDFDRSGDKKEFVGEILDIFRNSISKRQETNKNKFEKINNEEIEDESEFKKCSSEIFEKGNNKESKDELKNEKNSLEMFEEGNNKEQNSENVLNFDLEERQKENENNNEMNGEESKDKSYGNNEGCGNIFEEENDKFQSKNNFGEESLICKDVKIIEENNKFQSKNNFGEESLICKDVKIKEETDESKLILEENSNFEKKSGFSLNEKNFNEVDGEKFISNGTKNVFEELNTRNTTEENGLNCCKSNLNISETLTEKHFEEQNSSLELQNENLINKNKIHENIKFEENPKKIKTVEIDVSDKSEDLNKEEIFNESFEEQNTNHKYDRISYDKKYRSSVGCNLNYYPLLPNSLINDLRNSAMEKEDLIYNLKKKNERLQIEIQKSKNIKKPEIEIKEGKQIEIDSSFFDKILLSENEEIKRLSCEILELQELLNKKEINLFDTENGSLKSKINILENSLANLESENARLVRESLIQRDEFKERLINREIKKTLNIPCDCKEIQNFKEIFSLKNEIINLNSQISTLKSEIEILEKEKQILKDFSDSLKFRKTDFSFLEKASENELISEIQSLSQGFDDLCTENNKLLEEIDSNIRVKQMLTNEIRTLKNKNEILLLQTENLENERNLNQKKIINFEFQRTQNEKTEKNLKIQIEDLKNDYLERKSAAFFHKRNFIKIYNENSILLSQIDTLKNKFTDLKNKFIQQNETSNKLQSTINILEKDLKNTKNLLLFYFKDSSSEIFNEIEKYKKTIICSACDTNPKNTVIVKCMHVFCKQCLDKRIQLRIRKCPICGESFNINDIKKIYI
ncbi:hypothetical protein CWI37_1850p0010 [Hamiltosporidium tvaerminnensis]|uniref:E3 ubiquitin protein ligase n=1 Tax=Hamiltosporidium tvaerminnensis TaxID=1176355 RepID=A0A4Q9KUI2_9MICR|nr:hypothetical protein CWI37_1850p0010 [Hamiltosporidium tvaerminnensis]